MGPAAFKAVESRLTSGLVGSIPIHSRSLASRVGSGVSGVGSSRADAAPPRRGAAERLVDLLDGTHGGRVPAGFQATERFLPYAGQFRQLLLRESKGLSLADDVAGDRCANKLECGNVAVNVRFGERRKNSEELLRFSCLIART